MTRDSTMPSASRRLDGMVVPDEVLAGQNHEGANHLADCCRRGSAASSAALSRTSRCNSATPHSNIGANQSRVERTDRNCLRQACGSTNEAGFLRRLQEYALIAYDRPSEVFPRTSLPGCPHCRELDLYSRFEGKVLVGELRKLVSVNMAVAMGFLKDRPAKSAFGLGGSSFMTALDPKRQGRPNASQALLSLDLRSESQRINCNAVLLLKEVKRCRRSSEMSVTQRAAYAGLRHLL